MRPNARFWEMLDLALAAHSVVIERPQGSRHPRYPDVVYPLDYGYLEGTRSSDGAAIDVWIGAQPDRALVGAICTYDSVKDDLETKLLLGCTEEEAQVVLQFHDQGSSAAMLVMR